MDFGTSWLLAQAIDGQAPMEGAPHTRRQMCHSARAAQIINGASSTIRTMAVRPTLQLGDPLLRTPCHNVSDTGGPDLHRLAEDLSDTLADWVNRTGYGRGIAAPQIGEPVRVVYLTMGSPQTLINPTITAHSSATWEVWDACLSFSVEFFCKVRRFHHRGCRSWIAGRQPANPAGRRRVWRTAAARDRPP